MKTLDHLKLTKIIQDTIRQTFLAIAITFMNESQNKKNEKETYSDRTIKKLKAYPILKNNIKEHKQDLEDIYKEEFGSSPAVHIAQEYYCSDWTLDEIRHAKAVEIKFKIHRDQEVINQIDRAMNEIKSDYYAPVIQYIYFDKMKIDDIAEKLKCDKATIYRNRNRLLEVLALKFYGGDVVK